MIQTAALGNNPDRASRLVGLERLGHSAALEKHLTGKRCPFQARCKVLKTHKVCISKFPYRKIIARMKNERLAIIGANGQDGFLSTVLSLEQGARVLALSRKLDNRLRRLAEGDPRLTLYTGADYLRNLEDLRAILTEFNPTHLFYFASDHGPAGTMRESTNSMAATTWLNANVPEFLVKTAKNLNCGLTLPLSSRMYSGYLEGVEGLVEVDQETPPHPTDFYGEAKVKLLRISAQAREGGIYVNSPILFNHDSIFKKKGYVGWVAADYIAALFTSKPAEAPRNPSALVDISDAHKVVRLMLKMRNGANGAEFLSSGIALPISSLITEEARALGPLLGLETPKLKFLEGKAEGVLIASTSPIAGNVESQTGGHPWLGLMALSRLEQKNKSDRNELPVRLLEALPETYWGNSPGMIHQLSPVD
jgi:GDP-D-mannose dehydratase